MRPVKQQTAYISNRGKRFSQAIYFPQRVTEEQQRRNVGSLEDMGLQIKKRTCLKCNHLFDSEGPGNRICPACRRINNRLMITEEQLQKQRGVKRRNGELLEPDSDYSWI
jgi:hypothetical protein